MSPTEIPGMSYEWALRAQHALDVINLGLGGGLRLKASMLTVDATGAPYGVLTEYSDASYLPGDRKIIAAARRALSGQVHRRAVEPPERPGARRAAPPSLPLPGAVLPWLRPGLVVHLHRQGVS